MRLQPSIVVRIAVVIGRGTDSARPINTEEYIFVMEMAQGLIDSRQEALLRLSLALREFSPAVEMYRQVCMRACISGSAYRGDVCRMTTGVRGRVPKLL